MEEIKDVSMDIHPEALSHIELCLTMAYGVGFQQGLVSTSHRKAVVQLHSTYGTIINEFPSAAQAQRVTGINRSNIANVCNGRYGAKTTGGFKWKWKVKS